jgi:hypothetical protein
MVEDKYLLAVGSIDFSRQLAAIFQSKGWQVRSITNKQNAHRFLQEMQDTPHYLVTDKLKDWVIRLAKELQPQGTEIILSGGMTETPEELKSILGVDYYSIMGLPSKVADKLLGTQLSDEDVARLLFHKTEIEMMEGSVFDKVLQRHLGLDGLVVFHKQGFNPMNVFTCDYLADPNPDLVERTAIWSFGRYPSGRSVHRHLAEMLSEVSDKGGRTIGISQIAFCDKGGEDIDDSRADEMLLRMVSRYMEGRGSLLPIEKIFILIDQRCKTIRNNPM